LNKPPALRQGAPKRYQKKAPPPAPDSLPARLTAVIHGALGALKRSARAQAESQLRSGLLPRLTEAMTAWAQGSLLDAHSFAYHFFHRDADDQVVTSLRDAAVGAAMATRQDELAAGSKHLADAMTAEGLDTWPRFVAQALERARNPATLAAVAKSLQPVIRVAAAVGKPTSGSAGSGTKLAAAVENDPLKDQPSEGGGATVGHGGGAMPDIGPPAPGGDSGPPSAAEPLPVPAAPAEAPAAKPAGRSAEAPSTPPLTTLEIIQPGGRLIGDVNKGAGKEVRTVSPSEFEIIKDKLLEGAVPVSKPSYAPGTWFRRSDGAEFGIRSSDKNGVTIDIHDQALRPGLNVHRK
jgi:hypothetical protein